MAQTKQSDDSVEGEARSILASSRSARKHMNGFGVAYVRLTAHGPKVYGTERAIAITIVFFAL